MLQKMWHNLQNNPHLYRWISTGMFFLTMGFLLFLIIQQYEKLHQFHNWHAYLTVWWWGFLLYPISLGLQAFIWSRIIALMGQTTGGWRDIEVYAYTYLMRHLPSAVWYLTSRTVAYRERGIRARVTLMASGLEWLLLLVTALSIYGSLYLFNSAWLLGLTTSTLLTTGSLWIGKTFLEKNRSYFPPTRQWLGNLSVIAMLRERELLLWVGLYTIAYVIGGLILFFLARGIAPESSITLTDAIRIWALTGGISFLAAMIVPAGLGVREVTLAALLAQDVSTVKSLLIALLLRMLFIVGALVWGGLMWAIARVIGRQRNSNSKNTRFEGKP